MATPHVASSRTRKQTPRSAAVPAAGTLALPSPRHDFLWAALVLAVCTLALALPALSGGFLVNPMSDQFIGGFPVRNFAAASLKAGQGIPLWSPYLFGGMPYVAAMHGDIFYPTFLLRALLPTDVAMTWTFIIHVFLAGLFTYGFLRACGLSFVPSLLGSVAYMMSGPIAAYVSPGHDGKLFVSALLPLALWMLVRGIRDGRRWAWGVLAIVIGLAVLSPHPQLLQYLLLTCGAFSLYIAFGTTELPSGDVVKLDRGTALRRLAFALGAVALGMVMGAIQYLPVIEYVPFSPRAGGKGYEYATTYSLPIEELLNVYLPQFSGILNRYWGRNGIHLHSEYLGASVLLLAGAGLGSARRSFRWFWIGALIVSLLWALGGSTPFYHLVYAIIPGTKFFRAPSTMMFVLAFAVAVLAALGTERLLAKRYTTRYLIGWMVAAVIIALLASAGAFTNLAKVLAAGWMGDAADDFISGNNGAVIAGAWRSFLAVGLTAGTLWAFARGQLTARVVGIALISIVALDLFSVEKQYWMFSPRASVLYASDPAIEYMKKQTDPGRVIAFAPRGTTPGRDVMLDGDGLMVHDIRQLAGYHGNELGRYQKMLAASPQGIFSPALWRHENVRYLYTNVDPETLQKFFEQLGQPVPQKVVGPVKNAPGTQIYLYQVPGQNPVAWVAPAFVKVAEDEALATVVNPRFDPTRVAILDTNARIDAPRQLQSLPEPLNVNVRMTRFAPGALGLELASPPPAGSALIVSENYFPGWTALVDGKTAPVERTQYNLIGVQLPAGARSVSLQFDDPAYEKGKLITLLAVALALLAGIAGAVTDRRRMSVAR